jgi:hypothetical protein
MLVILIVVFAVLPRFIVQIFAGIFVIRTINRGTILVMIAAVIIFIVRMPLPGRDRIFLTAGGLQEIRPAGGTFFQRPASRRSIFIRPILGWHGLPRRRPHECGLSSAIR